MNTVDTTPGFRPRVAVIAPPYPLEEAPAPPLGVCYVAAAFERAGADVRIFDYVVSAYSESKLRAAMQEFAPHVVGSTSVTLNYHAAASVLEKAKEIDPGVITVMGGPHVSFYSDQTLETCPGIDLVVAGEGEATIAELTPRLLDRSAWRDIAGLVFRDNGRIRHTGRRAFIQDLDNLPMPARHLLPLSRYKALGFPVSIITSRGCPNQCIFCQGRRMVGGKVRFRDPSLVADEIEYLLSLGFNRINVADDLFTANRRRVSQLCGEIKRRKLEFGWSAFSRVNTIDEKTVRIMKDAGCDCISFGVESGNPEMLARIKKGITLDKARRAVQICKDNGVLAHASFMVGLPGETPETLADTEAFARELDVLYGYHFLAPFPGTTLYEKRDEYDIEILTDDWSLYDANRPVVRTSRVGPEQMIEFVKRYDAECDAEWTAMTERYTRGTASGDERLRVEGQRKLDMVFRVLSEDLVERHGAMNGVRDPQKALAVLSDRLAAECGKTPELVTGTLEAFVLSGFLRLESAADGARWQWAPNRE
ncbi:MAG: B12-binding domain-containing radical SAM protein [Desulfatibacillaceae bacterium]